MWITAIGSGTAHDGNAIGTGAQVNHAQSTAIGYQTQSHFDNEISLGNSDASYTASGITGPTALSRQTGPLQVVTSDADGHLATDGGSIFSALSELNGGVAIAIAMQNPDLVGDERFGIAGNVSYWNDNAALGFSAEGVLGHGIFFPNDRVAITGAVGVSVAEQSFGNRSSETTVGGRLGGQITWR